MFISIDGPSGAGKSTIVRHLAQALVAAGENVHITAEPSGGPAGVLCRELTETVTGHTLACLYAADRYHHVQTEIRPHMDRGETVITDRYIPSGLVMQRFDGIDPAFLWLLNSEADRPDLTVILEADPEVIAERLAARGPHNRFQLTPGSSHAEAQAGDGLLITGKAVIPDAWVVSTSGHIHTGPAITILRTCYNGPTSTPACGSAFASLHAQLLVTYQPGSRF
jgi:dTMP kinase